MCVSGVCVWDCVCGTGVGEEERWVGEQGGSAGLSELTSAMLATGEWSL